MEYDIKKGNYSKLEGEGLRNIMQEAFGNAVAEGDRIVSNYGALTSIDVAIKSKSVLEINTVSDKDAPLEVGMDTIKKWNIFLETVTGFTSKERGKRMQKKAKEGKL